MASRKLQILGALGLAAVGRLLDEKVHVGTPIMRSFDINRFLGNWYEIARLPVRYERGATDVMAQYSMRPDGTIRILNSCINERGEYEQIEATAWVPDPEQPGRLRVQFKWPFVSDFRIVSVGPNYRYAVVASRFASSLWILSRVPHLEPKLLQQAIDIASGLIDTRRLIFTPQSFNDKEVMPRPLASVHV